MPRSARPRCSSAQLAAARISSPASSIPIRAALFWPVRFSMSAARVGTLVFRFIKTITLCHLKVEGFPLESNGLEGHLVDAFENTMLEFVTGSDPDVAQERSGHLREGRLHEIEPGAVLGGMDVLEAPRAACQVGHRLLAGVGAVVVQYDADDRLARIVLMQAFEQGDELTTAMARLDVGDDLAVVQVQRRENGQGA